jgi:nicotinate phosphoribosyltransferase
MPYVGRERWKHYQEPLISNFSAMWTDFYELTIAQALFASGLHEKQTTFQYFIRELPFKGQPLFTGGQNIIHEYLDQFFSFTDADIDTLAEQVLPGTDVKVFQVPGFLDFLRTMKNELTIESIMEGDVAFPNQPIVRVTGPVYQCLILEPALMNACNSQSLFVTLADMFRRAASAAPLIEGALRRAQSVGGLEPSRAGYIGGFDTTSNGMAGRYYGIPLSGTMAHAYIMLFENEFDAIDNWLDSCAHMPLFLVDTYNTLDGVKRVIQKCKERGVKLGGIRLDSGDLAYLSIEARKLLDEAGFSNAKIVASNDLDIDVILSLRQQGAMIDRFLVGTNYGTAKIQPALGGVYKLAAVYDESLAHSAVLALYQDVAIGKVSREEAMHLVREKMKLSEQQIKMTLPGATDTIRIMDENGKYIGDVIVSLMEPNFIKDGRLIRDIISVDPQNPIMSRVFPAGTRALRPLSRIFQEGVLVGDIETVHEARQRVLDVKACFDDGNLRLLNPHKYPVGVEEGLLTRQTAIGRRLKREGELLPRAA